MPLSRFLSSRAFLTLVMILPALCVNPSAQAGWLNELGRSLGVGWSDGYHSFEGCPKAPPRSQPWSGRGQRSFSQDALPIYFAPAPPQPTPAAKKPTSTEAPSAGQGPKTSKLPRIARPNY